MARIKYMVAGIDVFNSEHIGTYTTDEVLDCIGCGFKHLFPIPANTEQYYEDDQFYQSHSPPDWFAKEQREYEAGMWDAYYSHLASLLPKGRRVIDYGCGAGWFVDYLRKIEQRPAYGIEPSRIAYKVSPAKKYIYESLNQWEIINGYHKFYTGSVVLSLVLEHIADPARFLQEDILPILDGRLVVVVPNDFSPLQRLVGGDWFVSPVHINYFNRQSLRALLERVGLKVVYEGATYPMEINLLLGRDYRGNDELGRKCHNQRLAFENRWGIWAFRWYRLLYRLFGIGRELIMVAEKQ